jgi:hypothetical protein
LALVTTWVSAINCKLTIDYLLDKTASWAVFCFCENNKVLHLDTSG